MVFLTEAMYTASIAASWRGKRMGSGCYWVDPMLSNVAKQLVTRFPYEIVRLSHDIAGGALGTAPERQGLREPEAPLAPREVLPVPPGLPGGA